MVEVTQHGVVIVNVEPPDGNVQSAEGWRLIIQECCSRCMNAQRR